MNANIKIVIWCLGLASFFQYFVYACCVDVTVAVLTERSAVTDFPSQLNRTIGLIEHAMNKTQELVQQNARVKFIIRNLDYPVCTDSHWGALLAELYYKEKINTIIGPGCTNAVQLAARMASSWKLPILTYGGTGESSADKTTFTTLSRLSFTMNQFADFYVEVFNAFSWLDVANIADSVRPSFSLIGNSLQKSFEKHGIRPHLLFFNSGLPDSEKELLRVLYEARKKSRVFVVCAQGDTYRKMALLAQSIGMKRGEYVLIFFNTLNRDEPEGDYSWKRGDNLDEEAKQAYESVMVIRPRRPSTEEYVDIEQKAMKRATEVYGYVWRKDAEFNVFNIAHYDCFMLYAHALNESLAAGEDPRDGTNVIKRMWNRTFPGLGGMTYINANGDRDADFSLIDMSPVSGDWRVVAQYLGYTKTFELFDDLFHWPGNGGPPPNKPRCGFDGGLCRSFSLPAYAIVSIAFSGVFLIAMVLAYLSYRRLKADAEINSQWWKIKIDDITIVAPTSSFGSSCDQFREGESHSMVTQTTAPKIRGVYKGAQVYIQKSKIKSLSIDRKLLLELKQMRDVTCTNLTRMIGLCPEPKNICIITEFCSRGSLQDVLQNESIQLDWDFRISLITDIVQGMNYIHNSPIDVHGRLTSSRCVIDSRFVLKIAGYGLPSLADLAEAINSKRSICPEFLWMAPELLREYPPRKCTQSGDVYSFAIILYEMCTRREPYVTEDWYESLEETIRQLKRPDRELIRPSLKDSESFPGIRKLIEACWQEHHEQRPSFVTIRKTVMSLRGGSKEGRNILDTLLHRMEQYANNLEGLVEERTRAFLEEKKKSEELLYQVLPKSVADQLRTGQSVIPEAYNSVTVYFSDIVGFTAISADSTPFEVVDLLNDVYTCFDAIIDNFDVYKVETIGDAYMVVSGLPVRNGNEHVRQISRMSLKILAKIQHFAMRHRPDILLKVRIGIHSGPVCAGVVGHKMPRYCLFGDTVNTASRMESNGEAMKIHISNSTKLLLDTFECFVTKDRGELKIKGKGVMTTHWLIDEIVHAF